MLPSVIMLTFLGINIKNAQTEMIALISGIIIAVSLIAMTVYYIYNRRIKKKQREITTTSHYFQENKIKAMIPITIKIVKSIQPRFIL